MTEEEQAQALCFDAARRNPRLHESLWADDEQGTRLAKATCARCPVREPCLDAGLHEEYGIWGGLGRRARQRLRHVGRVLEEEALPDRARLAAVAYTEEPTLARYEAFRIAVGLKERDPRTR